jgi:hypothetical protein
MTVDREWAFVQSSSEGTRRFTLRSARACEPYALLVRSDNLPFVFVRICTRALSWVLSVLSRVRIRTLKARTAAPLVSGDECPVECSGDFIAPFFLSFCEKPFFLSFTKYVFVSVRIVIDFTFVKKI